MSVGPCHRCEVITDVYKCFDCDLMACEECFTPQSMLSVDPYTNCLTCSGDQERLQGEEAHREWQRDEAARIKKEKRNAAARARYWQPENIRKRREKRAEEKRLQAEAARQRLAEAFRIVDDMMKGR